MLRALLGELESACVGRAGFVVAAEASEQVGTRGVVVAVVVEIGLFEQLECCACSLELGNGDRAVHRDDGRAGDLLELLVEQRDLFPVAVRGGEYPSPMAVAE